MSGSLRRIFSVDVGQRNLGVAIWEVTAACVGKRQKDMHAVTDSKPKLTYVACHDVLQSVGCAAKCNNVTKIDHVKHLCTFLASKEGEWDVGSVTDFVVEGQVRASPRNLSLTAALFSWFTLAHVKGPTPGKMPIMTTICAKNKFKAPNLPFTDSEDDSEPPKGKTKAAKKGAAYRKRKQDAVAQFGRVLSTGLCDVASPDVLQQWRTHKKKDDMADAALQGLWYMENKLGVALQ